MADQILKEILKNYEKKKFIAENIAENRKQIFLKKYPEINKINLELNNLAIEISKIFQKSRPLELPKTPCAPLTKFIPYASNPYNLTVNIASSIVRTIITIAVTFDER